VIFTDIVTLTYFSFRKCLRLLIYFIATLLLFMHVKRMYEGIYNIPSFVFVRRYEGILDFNQVEHTLSDNV